MSNGSERTVERRVEAEHRIKDGVAVCLGGPSSACHIYPDCECEFWDADEITGKHEHPDVSHAECWVLPWINSGDLEDSAYDEAVERRLDAGADVFPDGRIRYEWEGDFVLWTYIDEKETEDA